MEFLSKPKIKEYTGKPVSYRQVKFDGYYAEVYKSKSIPQDIAVYFKKQNINKWPKLINHDIIRDQLERLPFETVLRCELHKPGDFASSVPTFLDTADPDMLLSPFKIEMWAGNDKPYSFSIEESMLLGQGFTVPRMERLSLMGASITPAGVDAMKLEALARGIEGYVVRDVPGGNSWKIKPEKTVDAFVIETNTSESDSFFGGLKSVTVAVWDGDKQVEIGTAGTGFEADYRMGVDMKSLLGRVGEFGFQDLGSKGKMKFPKFLRWRDDEKTARECTIDQLKG